MFFFFLKSISTEDSPCAKNKPKQKPAKSSSESLGLLQCDAELWIGAFICHLLISCLLESEAETFECMGIPFPQKEET